MSPTMKREKIPPAKRDLHIPPVVVTAAGVVVNGHARLAAAQHLEIDEVPVAVVKHPDLRRLQSES